MTPEFHRDDRWWVSPFNVIDEVRRPLSLPPRVRIHDATLRDGEQTPGVVFSVADKIAIAEMLASVGVDRIEAGMGKKSGKASITYTLDQLGIFGASDEAVGEMLRLVKERSIARRGLVTLDEFRAIAQRVLADAAHPA
jgi:isopropylmalate/homocitrate/citramalate synthase